MMRNSKHRRYASDSPTQTRQCIQTCTWRAARWRGAAGGGCPCPAKTTDSTCVTLAHTDAQTHVHAHKERPAGRVARPPGVSPSSGFTPCGPLVGSRPTGRPGRSAGSRHEGRPRVYGFTPRRTAQGSRAGRPAQPRVESRPHPVSRARTPSRAQPPHVRGWRSSMLVQGFVFS